MNQDQWDRLFRAASAEPAPLPPAGFALRVLAAVRLEARPRSISLFEQLAELFPRVAGAAALVLALCAGTDLYLSNLGPADLSAGIAEASDQWFFAVR